MSNMFYVSDMLLENGAYGAVVGKSPEYSAQMNQLMHSAPESLDELLEARTKGTRRLKPEELPKVFHVERRKKIPNIFRISDGITVVSEPMMNVLQKLDPDIHQFFPIQIMDSKGVETPESYFIFHFFTHKKALVEVQPAIEGRIGFNGVEFKMLNTGKIRTNPLQLYPSAMEGAHFWRSKDFPYIYFVSADLLESVKAAGLLFYKTMSTVIVS